MSKRSHLKKLALLGITGGVMLASKAIAHDNSLAKKGHDDDGCGAIIAMNNCGGKGGNGCGGKSGNGNNNERHESWKGKGGNGNNNKNHENGLRSKLDSETQTLYDSLDAEGKALANQLADHDCKGQNECKGLNSCKTDENDCAGQGGCKGQSSCKFEDKNLAVKVAAKKMAEKRHNMHNGQ